MITSTRGARGGYVLAKPPAEISIRDVIHASELETFDLHCVSHPVEEERCSASHNCSIRPVWVMLQQRIDDVLQGVSLADLLHDEPTVRERVGLPSVERTRPGEGGPADSRDGLDRARRCRNGASVSDRRAVLFQCRRGDSNPHELAPTGS